MAGLAEGHRGEVEMLGLVFRIGVSDFLGVSQWVGSGGMGDGCM